MPRPIEIIFVIALTTMLLACDSGERMVGTLTSGTFERVTRWQEATEVPGFPFGDEPRTLVVDLASDTVQVTYDKDGKRFVEEYRIVRPLRAMSW